MTPPSSSGAAGGGAGCAAIDTASILRRHPVPVPTVRTKPRRVIRGENGVDEQSGALVRPTSLSILRSVSGGVAVTFHGVRGSTPCAGPQFARYGGHSSCVVLEAADQPPIVFDLGTGLRQYGLDCMADGPFHGTALLSHLHWDHVQGLPFFVAAAQARRDARRLRPAPGRGSARRGVRADDAPAVLPDPADRPRAATSASTTPATTTSRSGSRRCARGSVRHVGATLGFRVEWNGMLDRVPPRSRPGHGPDRRRRLRAARRARALRRRRPADPRRAAHAARSTSRSATGVTARSTTRCTSRASPARGSSCCSITTRSHGDDDMDASVATRPTLARAHGRSRGRSRRSRRAASCTSRRTRPMTAPRARDEPVGSAATRSRRRDLSGRCSVTSRPAS